MFQRVSITWLRQRESEKNVLCPQRGWGWEIGAIRTWISLEGLPSKYYSGPLLLNFSVRMGTGVSNMVNPLTIKLFITLYPGLSKFIFIFEKKISRNSIFAKLWQKWKKLGTSNISQIGNSGQKWVKIWLKTLKNYFLIIHKKQIVILFDEQQINFVIF